MYSFVTSDIIEKRIVTNVDYQYNITHYGLNNLYPQIMDELYKRSPLTKQAIKKLTQFSMGLGWTSQGDKVVNRFGQTFNDILRLVCEDVNTFSGFAMHFNFNATGKIEEIQHIPFPYVRLGAKDINGITDNVKVSNNWEGDSQKFKGYTGVTATTYPLFNPKTAAEDALLGGGGHVLYWTPRMFAYPLATFDAIRDAVETDHSIQIFSRKNMDNGFLGTTIFKYPGGFDSEEDKRRTLAKVKGMTGAYNANSTIVAETPEDFTGSLIESIPAPNNDTLFNLTGQKVVDTILQNFSVPGPLLAVNPQGAVFSQEQIRDSYILMNLTTESTRKTIERVFDPIAKLFGVRLGKIKQIPWEIPGQNDPKLNGDPNQLKKEAPKEEVKEEEEKEEPKEEAKLVKLYG